METKEIICSFKKYFWQVQLNMQITWSKFIALLVLLAATYIDISQELKGMVFLASLTAVTFLITGRWIKEVKEDNNKIKSKIEKDG